MDSAVLPGNGYSPSQTGMWGGEDGLLPEHQAGFHHPVPSQGSSSLLQSEGEAVRWLYGLTRSTSVPSRCSTRPAHTPALYNLPFLFYLQAPVPQMQTLASLWTDSSFLLTVYHQVTALSYAGDTHSALSILPDCFVVCLLCFCVTL